jgi:glycosyltransferase involved in cell wall biosynthesis
MARRLRSIIRESRPDLMLTYNWGALDAITAAVLPPRIRVIHTEDGFGAEEADHQIRRRVLFRRLLLPQASKVIAPSRVLFQIMRDVWKVPESRIVYIPNGVDTDRFTPALDRASRVETVIGTAANLRPEKRLELLLQAFAAVAPGRNLRLEIAGDGSEREKLETMARDRGIAALVKFHGHLDDLPSFYRNLDIYALTSSTEQMPLSILEAMASGLPIVSTDVGDVRNMVSAENKRFVAPVAGLRDAMETILDEGIRKRLKLANRSHCVSRYRLSGMLQSYEELYRRASWRLDPTVPAIER